MFSPWKLISLDCVKERTPDSTFRTELLGFYQEMFYSRSTNKIFFPFLIIVWLCGMTGSTLTEKLLEQIQNRDMRIILREGRNKCTLEMGSKLRLFLYSAAGGFLDL